MWHKFNPNPHGSSVGDCAVRAVAAATGRSWEQAYISLALTGYALGDMPSANRTWGAYLQKHGFKRRFVEADCTTCYTVADFAREYNGYPQVYYPQQPQGQLEQLRAAQYQPQPVMMPTMQGQAAPTDSGFIWVQGEAAARGYLVANGSRVLLLDADSDTFYIKEVGQDGRPFPLRIYDYKERTGSPKASIAATQAASGEYVTRKEFDALAAKLAALEKQETPEPEKES